MAARDATLESYRRNAEGFVRKFEARASRRADVESALRLAGVPRPRVLEMGFGSAREAGLFLEAGARYEGIDYSPEFVAMARARFPGGKFATGDVRTCPLPSGLDAVCAIASLVRLNRRELTAVLARLAGALRPGGVLVADLRAGSPLPNLTHPLCSSPMRSPSPASWWTCPACPCPSRAPRSSTR